MTLLDILDLYAMENDSNDLFLMLQSYTLDNRIDREKMNRIILKEIGDLRPITNTPEVFKMLLEAFFDKWSYNISRLVDTMYANYNPIENKYIVRTEDERNTRDDDRSILQTNDLTTKTDANDKINTSAYDVDTYQPRTETINDGTTKDTGTVDTQDNLDRVDTVDRDITEHGKDGNSSYQELIAQERELADFNIFNWIIKRMRKELFIMVY